MDTGLRALFNLVWNFGLLATEHFILGISARWEAHDCSSFSLFIQPVHLSVRSCMLFSMGTLAAFSIRGLFSSFVHRLGLLIICLVGSLLEASDMPRRSSSSNCGFMGVGKKFGGHIGRWKLGKPAGIRLRDHSMMKETRRHSLGIGMGGGNHG